MPNEAFDALTIILGCSWELNKGHWEEFPDDYVQGISKLQEPSGLTTVYLAFDISMRRGKGFGWRDKMIDLSGTTVEEAIKRILEFYSPSKIYKSLGSQIYMKGLGHYLKGDLVLPTSE